MCPKWQIESRQAHNEFKFGYFLHYKSFFYVKQLHIPSMNQQECRKIQEKLNNCSPEDKAELFEHIILQLKYYSLGNFLYLFVDQFGNYVAQKLYELADIGQKKQMLNVLSSDILEISKSIYGKRVLQKIIMQTNDSLRSQLSLILQPHVVEMCKHQHSCHIIQRCLVSWNRSDNFFVYEQVKMYALEICTNQWGCCIFQRCMDYMENEHKVSMAQKICENLIVLIQDPFGNYVVQYILDMEIDFLIHSTIDLILAQCNSPKFLEFCCQKFSSNVMEKCIRVANRSQRRLLIDCVIGHVGSLLEDAFGNYVLQTALDFAEEDQKCQVIFHFFNFSFTCLLIKACIP